MEDKLKNIALDLLNNFKNELVKMKIDIAHAEFLFNRAIKLLNGDCPKETCEWCKGR